MDGRKAQLVLLWHFLFGWRTVRCVKKLLLHSNVITTQKCYPCRSNCKRFLFCKLNQAVDKFLSVLSFFSSFCVSLDLCLWKFPPISLLSVSSPPAAHGSAQHLKNRSSSSALRGWKPWETKLKSAWPERRRRSKKTGEGMLPDACQGLYFTPSVSCQNVSSAL